MKQLFSIKTGEDKENVQPVLCLRLGEKHCCYSITDFASQELKHLAYYTADEVNDSFLLELFAANPELSASFYQVFVCYDHPQSCLVPTNFYKQENASPLINTMFGTQSSVSVISETVPGWQMHNVYAVPKELYDAVSKKFVTGRYWHRYTVDIKNIYPATESGSFLVDFGKENFTVLASGNDKLLLAQTFLYSTPDDVIYYLLKSCRQLGLQQTEVQISLSGLVDQQSALYRELHQYFLHVEFRNTTWKIPASANDEIPAHFFTSLNDLARCAS